MRTILQKIILLIALTIFFGTVVYAEENNNDPTVNDIMKNVKKHKPTNQTNTENILICNGEEARKMLIEANILNVQITAALYAFSLIIIIIFMWDKKHQSNDIVTMVGMVSVIFGVILLVLMIGDTGQLTAPMGILGAIAGYLFGASKKTEESGEG